jgi:maltose/moltooligosaccharide transporter
MIKARLRFWQIWNMCFGFLGIQIGFGLQNANVSRIFQTLGADIDHLAILWIAAPVTGLLVQPIIGLFSDKTWGPLGRRRPYFLFGAILATAALMVMPNSPALWVAAIMLWVMDASINVTMEPFRAFVGDLLPDDQRTSGFAMQSFFIGVGAVLASALPWILHSLGVPNTAPAGHVPPSVQWAFYIGAAGLLLSVLWTVVTSREYSPQEVEAMAAAEAKTKALPFARPNPIGVRTLGLSGLACMAIGAGFTALIFALKLEKELYVLAGFTALFGLLQILAAGLTRGGHSEHGLVEIIQDLFQMPKVMRQLAVVQFFSWFGLFAMWIYATSAVTSFHYGTSDPTSAAYNTGADWVGILFSVYNGVAALVAFLLPVLAAKTSRKIGHMICLSLGGLGLISFPFIKDPNWLWIGMIGMGFAWASILSAPYSILSGALPPTKMGVYMGIFNIFIVIPQLLAATLLGILLKSVFHGQAIEALVLGGASLLIAAASVLFVNDPLERRAQA